MNLYSNYLNVKKQYKDALLFYRVGDFYELYAHDAVKASEVLNLTLTGRDFGLPERVPMCGVPFHSVDSYIAKLVQEGYKTAICESAPQKVDIKLNLTAETAEERVLKEYLENNASDVLKDKINNGVRIEKDGKTLINKKTLETFLKYACDEAQKQAEKGARGACIKDDTVYGWLIHFFEEDSIEGTIYNEDGTEYKPPKPAVKNRPVASVTATAPKPKPKTEFSLFDLMSPPSAPEPEPDGQAADESDESETDESESDNSDEEFDESEAADADVPEEPAIIIPNKPKIPEPKPVIRNKPPAIVNKPRKPIIPIISDEPEAEEELPELRQISETQYVDKDGVIYDTVEVTKNTVSETAKTVVPIAIKNIVPEAAKSTIPAATKNTVPEALTEIFGSTLIMR